MKNLLRFCLWHATLCAALIVATSALATHAYGQDAPGGKPEMAAPNSAMAMHAHTAKVPSTTLTLSLGQSETAKTLTAADLASMPHESVTVVNGHTKASETYSGVPVAALLAKLGLPFEKANEHTLLKTCLVAEGTDGYKVIVSAYETLSAIRRTSVIVADTLVGPDGGKPLTMDGAFKLIIPGDTRPQRWVQNLKSLTVKTID